MHERIENYLKTTNLAPYVINVLSDDRTTITLASDPTDEQVTRIREMLLFRDEIHVFPPLSDMVIVDGRTIDINVPHYEAYCKLYQQLKDFGVKVTDAKFESKNNLMFTYLLKGRSFLLYDELGVLQNIIDPTIKHHDSIRVMVSSGECTMRIDFTKH